MIQNVTNTARVMPLRSLNKSPLTTAFPTPQAKVIRDGADVLLRAEITHLGDDGALQLDVEPLSSRSDQARPMSNKENPLSGLMQLLGDLFDGDIMVDLVTIMGEPDEAAALLATAAMQARIERRMLSERIGEDDAAAHALQVVGEVRDAWTALHRRAPSLTVQAT